MMRDYGLEQVPQSQDGTEVQQIKSNLPAPPPAQESELDAQIRVARKNPRDIRKAMTEAFALIAEPGVAEKCWYSLERYDRKSGKMTKIEGPSARLAEIAFYAWGNIGQAGNVIEIGQTEVVAEGLAIDFERNTRVRIMERRSIVGKRGRYSQEMCEITAKVAQSIAMRNAVFKVVPGAFVKRLLDHARSVANAGPIEPKIAAMMEWAKSEGLTETEVLRWLGLGSLSEIGLADLARLRGVAGAIRDGETTTDEEFRKPYEEAKRRQAEKMTKPEPAPKETAAKAVADPPSATEGQAEKEQEAPTPAPLRLDAAREYAKKTLGPKLFAIAWDYIAAAADSDHFVAAVCKAPKTIIEAACTEDDPVEAMRTIANTISAR